MNQYEIVSIGSNKVLTHIQAKNRKQAAKKAAGNGHKPFRVRLASCKVDPACMRCSACRRAARALRKMAEKSPVNEARSSA